MGAYHTIKMPFFDKIESGQLMSRLTDDTKLINEFLFQKANLTYYHQSLRLLGY